MAYSGAGGQSGGYAESLFSTAAAMGASQTITIGAAGAGGVGASGVGAGDGGDGADCSFGTLVIARGGAKGTYTYISAIGQGGYSTTAGVGDYSCPARRGFMASM